METVSVANADGTDADDTDATNTRTENADDTDATNVTKSCDVNDMENSEEGKEGTLPKSDQHQNTRIMKVHEGHRTRKLQDNCLLKLKATYVLIEHLYTGSLSTIRAVAGNKEPVKLIKDMLEFLYNPKLIEELKRLVARVGATYSLSRAVASSVELDPEEMTRSFLELKADRSAFNDND
ncbi:hypothetical protein D1007_21408 [Hordeum vulgare]|nr:hypothetical protein D1007_21408 [Hordeum vulgare]